MAETAAPHPPSPAGWVPPFPHCAGLSGDPKSVVVWPLCSIESASSVGSALGTKAPLRPSGGRGRGPGEGEVGSTANHFVGPPHPALSPRPAGGESKMAGRGGKPSGKREVSIFPG